ncbi:MAG: PEP-CTERM sorting domain-containing protein [Pseudomonadota bacterium]
MKQLITLSALALAGMAAQAAPVASTIDVTLNFDNVAAGSAANSALGSLGSLAYFANPDVEWDVDEYGDYTGSFHWIDATATYGDVLVGASSYAVSGGNVLSNSGQPILLVFSTPVDIASFSIQQDTSGFGNPQAGGTYLSFLDATGHEISAANVFYTQAEQPGLTIQLGAVSKVSAVLLAGGVSYDNLHIAVTPAVPEPAAGLLALLGAGVVLARRSRQRG